MWRNPLRSILVEESRAYGFTIAFWGSGAILINNYGVPSTQEAFLYALGAITGFGIMALLAFSSYLKEAEKTEDQYLVLSTIHYIASLGPILITSHLTSLKPFYGFFLSGASVTIVYNLLQLVEEFVSEEVKDLEENLLH